MAKQAGRNNRVAVMQASKHVQAHLRAAGWGCTVLRGTTLEPRQLHIQPDSARSNPRCSLGIIYKRFTVNTKH